MWGTIPFSQREYSCRKDCILLNISFFNFYTDLDSAYVTQSKQQMTKLFEQGFFSQFTTLQVESIKSLSKVIAWARHESNDSSLHLLAPIQMEQRVNSLFIVLQGALKVKTIHTINFTNKWPKGLREWEIKHVQKSFYYESQLTDFDFFGDHEILTRHVSDYEIKASKFTLLLELSERDFLQSTPYNTDP